MHHRGRPRAIGAPGSSGAARLVEAISSRDADRVARIAFEVNLSPEFIARAGAFDHFVSLSRQRRVPSAVVAWQAGACAAHDTRDRIGSLDMPTAVIHGDVDEMIAFAEGERLADLIPQATLARCPTSDTCSGGNVRTRPPRSFGKCAHPVTPVHSPNDIPDIGTV
ncbi:alpha/beta hydrolase [Gordonia sp. SMJS1]|uniref:alpha/beta fold hydrolase n=1 Tax=Gordonia sp. SMJS1 TaxID=3039400 RepID=UPI0024587D2C|nr:alpha/beta hydrolase [Gordonia sp. SMJS1]WGJ88016.1 alpha/beta hydrolase [Gordonia sp. SMJS1]